MLKEFAEASIMPNTAELISQGIFKTMQSSIPEVSSVAWSSMITGRNPGQHGIFGFTDLLPNSYKLKFPNYNDLKATPFWDQWEGRSVIINVPSTYPVRKMNGVLISGFVSIDFEKSVYPPSLVPKLKEMDYRLDVDSQKAHESMDLFLSDLEKTLDARIEAYRYLWASQDWDTFMLVFTGTDRLLHFLWDAYEDKEHRYHNLFVEHFKKIDGVIGEINDGLGEDDLIVVHSDHGFERLDKDVYINHVLREEGFLQFEDNQEITLNKISHGTKAFALDPARIYLNLKGKYPNGTVEQHSSDDLLRRLEELFASLEADGRKIIKSTYRKEQIYSGPCLENAPDLVLVAAEGFNLKAKVDVQSFTDKGIFTGKHTQDTAFLLVKDLGLKAIIPDKPIVSDIKSIIEKYKIHHPAP
jgi:predicted AlkP superfamily phosphohydrolase/phosphomutase